MEEQPKENPFKQPKVAIITKEHAEHIANKGGIAANPANPKTPAFMVKHQDNPKSLPEQGKPKTPNKN